ncbi:phospholipase D [Metarhizium acridum CQMa 102]|uniref:Phospholipase D n=1 Tax=Metarhizium acridum (strain CQMa 102) TaxID=655827 RepID=E9DWG5_METAQ|nr:phospholipase D [Metarhizium acridum CQMa 102]EFY92015.1 phospholipase D [Metarhizium acridum CQMa 102]
MVVVSKFTGRWALWALASLGRLTPVASYPKQDAANGSMYDRNNFTGGGYVPDIVPKPFYAIANRILTKQDALDALEMGANALYIPVRGWTHTGWWADYDGKARTAGDRLHHLFKEIAKYRVEGRNICLVWLDLRSPDFCTPHYARCTFDRLVSFSRNILQSEGIYVLYGFHLESVNGSAYTSLQDDINDMEAISLEGELADVNASFWKYGPSAPDSRVMSYGYFDLATPRFGHCNEERFYVCSELKRGANSRGEIGKTYAWTVSGDQSVYVDRLMEAGVDGLVFGFKAINFRDHEASFLAFRNIVDWIDSHPDRYLANIYDKPWDRRLNNESENK